MPAIERRKLLELCKCKRSERNFAAAVGSLVVIVAICTAIVEPNWLFIKGGKCRTPKQLIHYLGTNQFFAPGEFRYPKSSGSKPYDIVYLRNGDPNDSFTNCFDSHLPNLMRLIITVCFIGIVNSLFGFTLDMMGPTNLVLRFVRRNALPAIFTIIACIVIIALIYWASTIVHETLKQHKLHPGSKVIVDFSVSVYLILCAGMLSVIVAGLNLLRTYSSRRHARMGADVDLLALWTGDGRGARANGTGDRDQLLSNQQPVAVRDSSSTSTTTTRRSSSRNGRRARRQCTENDAPTYNQQIDNDVPDSRGLAPPPYINDETATVPSAENTAPPSYEP